MNEETESVADITSVEIEGKRGLLMDWRLWRKRSRFVRNSVSRVWERSIKLVWSNEAFLEEYSTISRPVLISIRFFVSVIPIPRSISVFTRFWMFSTYIESNESIDFRYSCMSFFSFSLYSEYIRVLLYTNDISLFRSLYSRSTDFIEKWGDNGLFLLQFQE